jgi:hypothetical protein
MDLNLKNCQKFAKEILNILILMVHGRMVHSDPDPDQRQFLYIGLPLSVKLLISVSACYSSVNRRCLGEYAKMQSGDKMFLSAIIPSLQLAHLIDFLNRVMPDVPQRNLQNLNCLKIHPANLIACLLKKYG